ncbi:MAG: S8 family peptidase [Xenococcaceae cyanobacterium]
MKKFLLISLVVIGLCFALFNFKGLAGQGKFDSIVIDFREEISTAEITQELLAIAQKYHKEATLNSLFSIDDRVYIIEGDSKLLNALKHSPLNKDTEYIEPNYQYSAFDIPDDPEYSKQWNFRSINVEQAWDETKGGGITVAVIDTGISKVPDLKATNFVEGYDFVNDRVDASDDQGHGTHVAGTIAQSTNNGYGVAGIAYEAKLMPIKVLAASGGGTIADIAEGIKFAADRGANIINMSLGGGGESNLMKEAIDYAHKKGVVIIAAAGNSNQNASAYPARYPHVISVAATGAAGEKAPYSNFGAGVDIAAPGGSNTGKILQNTIDPRTGESAFLEFQGTSMAAPHVAGVAALIEASGISEPDRVRQILLQSARKVKEDPLNHYGAGHLDAAASVKLAVKGQITFRDFFRWLRDNGYLNPRFWIDGGAVALLPKLAMVLGSYLLAWFLRVYFPMSLGLNLGLVAGSSGLFFLRGLYIFDLPQWPFRVMGSSIPELGNAVTGGTSLNPIFASVLIPFCFFALLSGNKTWKKFAIGATIGIASCLVFSAWFAPAVWGLGSGAIASGFLIVNALLCLGLVKLATKK